MAKCIWCGKEYEPAFWTDDGFCCRRCATHAKNNGVSGKTSEVSWGCVLKIVMTVVFFIITVLIVGLTDSGKDSASEKKDSLESVERTSAKKDITRESSSAESAQDESAYMMERLEETGEATQEETPVVAEPESAEVHDNVESDNAEPDNAEPETLEEETKIFDVVEQMPSFPGGQGALMEYLSKNVKCPVVAQENGVQGRVVVSFVVERDGSFTDVKVVRSVDPSLDREAMRVVSSMPKWIPGKQNGSAVRVRFNMPVSFRLQ